MKTCPRCESRNFVSHKPAGGEFQWEGYFACGHPLNYMILWQNVRPARQVSSFSERIYQMPLRTWERNVKVNSSGDTRR